MGPVAVTPPRTPARRTLVKLIPALLLCSIFVGLVDWTLLSLIWSFPDSLPSRTRPPLYGLAYFTACYTHSTLVLAPLPTVGKGGSTVPPYRAAFPSTGKPCRLRPAVINTETLTHRGVVVVVYFTIHRGPGVSLSLSNSIYLTYLILGIVCAVCLLPGCFHARARAVHPINGAAAHRTCMHRTSR